jgi:hypothetical protein
MNRIYHRLSGLSLFLATFTILGGGVWAQEWHAVWQPPADGDNKVNQVDWEQRLLKRPQHETQTDRQRPVATASRELPTIQQEETRTASLDRNSMNSPAIMREIGPSSRPRARLVDAEQPEVIPPGMALQPVPEGAEMIQEGMTPHHSCGCGHGGVGFEDLGEGCGSCGGPCGDNSCGPCEEPCDLGWEVFDGKCGPFLRGLSVFAGADGFKGSLDHGGNGNFGLNEGLNLARPLGDPWNCGYQIGANFVQSDFSGASVVAVDNNQYNLYAPMRKQYFATAGIFQRAQGRGLQWGVAYDFLHDIYFQNANLQQIRTETGFVLNDVYEIGYYGAYGISSDKDRVDSTFKLNPTDMFLVYIRRTFENGGDGRVWAGATCNGDGLVGADLWIPLGDGLALENRINYMIPKQGTGTDAIARESWGLISQIVWYPGQNAKCQQKNPYRAMFNVADNSLFMVDRLAH